MTESNVQPFEFRGNPVATVTTGNGTVLFCAKHVATALGYSNTRDAIRKHCRHIDGVANRYPITDSLGRTQQAVFITEGDVYRLIASSKLTSAVEFEHWLFDEETRQPETGKCDCPVCDPDKDTVEERLFHPVDQWQHAVDEASDVHDAAGSLEHALFELGENQLAFEASMILSQSLTLLRAIQRKRKEVAE